MEFYGPGLASLALADRATIGNMSPEYGATCAIFPVDEVTLRYLRFTGRSPERVALVEAYMKEQGLFHSASSPEPLFSRHARRSTSARSSRASPGRAARRTGCGSPRRGSASGRRSRHCCPISRPGVTRARPPTDRAGPGAVGVWGEGTASSPAATAVATSAADAVQHGSVVIAAITSCTNTSNPSVMLAAGLLAKKAVERGLERKPWVKTSLAPGSKVVTQYYDAAGLTPFLDKLGFQLVGYGCTTCIGNSGPLPEDISQAIQDRKLVAAAALSGNRNFEGRINSDVRANYLMSPPLVVAFAIAGRIDIDLTTEPLGTGRDGKPVFLRDIWPTQREIEDVLEGSIRSQMYQDTYAHVFDGDERWKAITVPAGDQFAWEDSSTYVRRPSYFDDMPPEAPETVARHHRCPRHRAPGRQRDHRSHLARRQHQARLTRRPVSHGTRCRAEGLQFLRLAPGKS